MWARTKQDSITLGVGGKKSGGKLDTPKENQQKRSHLPSPGFEPTRKQKSRAPEEDLKFNRGRNGDSRDETGLYRQEGGTESSALKSYCRGATLH